MKKDNEERTQLVQLVKNIIEYRGNEDGINDLLLELENRVPHPAVSDLIFYPENDDVTPEEIVEEALSYKVTLL